MENQRVEVVSAGQLLVVKLAPYTAIFVDHRKQLLETSA
jgi:hypothetical protein